MNAPDELARVRAENATHVARIKLLESQLAQALHKIVVTEVVGARG